LKKEKTQKGFVTKIKNTPDVSVSGGGILLDFGSLGAHIADAIAHKIGTIALGVGKYSWTMAYL